MHGMNAETGKKIQGLAHIKQSIKDIITTRIGERVMRPSYGCELANQLDAPLNESNILKMYSSIATALDTFETRIQVTNLTIKSIIAGQITLDLVAFYNSESITLDDIQCRS